MMKIDVRPDDEAEKPITSRRGDAPIIEFFTDRVKPLAEVTGNDVPLGLDPEDVATDFGD